MKVYKLQELERILDKARGVLDGKGIPLVRIAWSKSFDKLPSVDVQDDGLASFESSVRPDAHAFYWWDEIETEGKPDEGTKAVLRIALWQGGLVYDWSLPTQAWADFVEEADAAQEDQSVDRLGRPLPPLTKEQEALLKRLQKDRDALVVDVVERSIAGTNPKDLTLPAYKVAQIGETEIGLDSIPYEHGGRAYEITQQAREQVEAALLRRKEEAVSSLVDSFPGWYEGKGSPRMNKPLVKMFIEEQGYKCPNSFVDDVKVRLDVLLTRA